MCLMFLKLEEEMSYCEQAEHNVQEIITLVTSCPLRSLHHRPKRIGDPKHLPHASPRLEWRASVGVFHKLAGA